MPIPESERKLTYINRKEAAKEMKTSDYINEEK